MPNLLEYALRYQGMGLFILPLPPGSKQPYVKWKDRRDKRPEPDEIRKWWKKWPKASIGMATGKYSGVDVIDFDDADVSIPHFEATIDDLPDTIDVLSGGGGRHYWFEHNGHAFKNISKPKDPNGRRISVDIRTTGGIIVLPPSPHKSGREYSWGKLNPLEMDSIHDELQPMPERIANFFEQASGKDGDEPGERLNISEILSGLDQGQRDTMLFKYCCRLRAKNLEYNEAKELILAIAMKCSPPFPQSDAIKKLDQAWKYNPGAETEQPETSSRKTAIPAGITAAELLRKEFPEPRWAIEKILPEGLNILAGKPKQGKSILALNVALSIALGGKALQSIPVVQGAVIYLALEDPPRRLQNRIKQMLTYADSGPDKLRLFTDFPRMGGGGIKALDTLIEQTKDIRLVIIDTLALFKPPARAGNSNQYADEYEMVSRIKKIADKHGVSILLIHHLRKMQSDDVFEMFSGTLGLTGAADGLLAMTRNTTGPVLHITGRDVEPQELAMELDPTMLSWRLIGAAADVQSTKEKQLLYDTLKKADGPLSPKEIMDITGLKHRYVRDTLPTMVKMGVIKKKDYGKYIYINDTYDTSDS